MQTDATLLANNSQRCWMLHIPSVCLLCYMLLRVVESCCAKFETGQTLSYVQRTQQLPTLLAQQCWELLRPFARSFNPYGDGVKLSRNMENLNTRQRFPFSLFVNLDTVL